MFDEYLYIKKMNWEKLNMLERPASQVSNKVIVAHILQHKTHIF